MAQVSRIFNEPFQGTPDVLTKVKPDKANQSAEASRFQRSYIALCCIFAVLFKEPGILYPVMVSTLITLLSSTRYEPSVLFYRYILIKVLGREPWPISEDASGKYLLGNSAEKFIFTVMGLFVFAGLYLQACGAGFWIVPVAIVAAGTSLAATTGICLMGVSYIQVRKLFSKKINLLELSADEKHGIEGQEKRKLPSL